MKIKQIEIKDFGSIYRQTIAFSPDMNVLYTEKERTRREIQAFIESMLFGRTDVPYAGVLWFESGGRNYRLTRDLHREEPTVSFSARRVESSLMRIISVKKKWHWVSVKLYMRMQSVFLH